MGQAMPVNAWPANAAVDAQLNRRGPRRPPKGMKILIAALFGVALAAAPTPTPAYVVEVATSIDTAGTTDAAGLAHAVHSAIQDVVQHAVAFSPTAITIQDMKMVGDRLYLLLLLTDEDGETTMKNLAPPPDAPTIEP